MVMFVLTWPGRPEVVVCDEPTAGHAEDRLRDGRLSVLAAYGRPQVREVESGELLAFHPMHFCRDPTASLVTLKVESYLGVAQATPDPRFAKARRAWFDFQDRAVALLDRYPALSGLVPPVVRAAWDAGTASVFDLLVEVGERVVPDLVELRADEERKAAAR